MPPKISHYIVFYIVFYIISIPSTSAGHIVLYAEPYLFVITYGHHHLLPARFRLDPHPCSGLCCAGHTLLHRPCFLLVSLTLTLALVPAVQGTPCITGPASCLFGPKPYSLPWFLLCRARPASRALLPACLCLNPNPCPGSCCAGHTLLHWLCFLLVCAPTLTLALVPAVQGTPCLTDPASCSFPP